MPLTALEAALGREGAFVGTGVVCVEGTEGRAAEGASSGGSSAVEQRTVKCASAAILWSGVQISLSGFLFFSFGAGSAQVGGSRAAGGRAAEGASSGGSSAVEQRTVKCASAAILWSGVQISLSGFLFFRFWKKEKFDLVVPPGAGCRLLWRSWQRVGLIILRSRVRSSPGAFWIF